MQSIDNELKNWLLVWTDIWRIHSDLSYDVVAAAMRLQLQLQLQYMQYQTDNESYHHETLNYSNIIDTVILWVRRDMSEIGIQDKSFFTLQFTTPYINIDSKTYYDI